MAYVKARLYLSRWTKESKRQPLAAPHMLTKTIFILGGLVGTSYGIILLDTWLHISSRAAYVTRTSQYSSTALDTYGRALNETRCSSFDDMGRSDSLPANFTNLCGLYMETGDTHFIYSAPEGLRTLSNASVYNLVVRYD